MTSEEEVTDNPRMFPALRVLERRTPPTLYGHPPFWRPAMTPASSAAFIPSWNWTGHCREIPEDVDAVTLDTNGAFLAALGSVKVAHSQLRHTGPLDATAMHPRHVWSGYYRITPFTWAFDATMVSPLGTSEVLAKGGELWVAHPTLVLLLELLADGYIPHFDITDSWSAERMVEFREWGAALKKVRNGLLDQRDAAETDEEIRYAKARYNAFKEGYGAAFSMMLTGERCQTRRPDWAHAVYAQHAATSWRKAWRFSAIGPVLRMGAVDELTVIRADLDKALTRPQPPVKLDPSGRLLGHLKEKKPEPPAEQLPGADEFVMSDDFGDVL
jgi:hypothetical protein